jgi:hypothetical protein
MAICEIQRLDAMAHWHFPAPAECRHQDRKRHLLDDNPASG